MTEAPQSLLPFKAVFARNVLCLWTASPSQIHQACAGEFPTGLCTIPLPQDALALFFGGTYACPFSSKTLGLSAHRVSTC